MGAQGPDQPRSPLNSLMAPLLVTVALAAGLFVQPGHGDPQPDPDKRELSSNRYWQDSNAYAGTSLILKGGRNNLYCGLGGDFVLRCDHYTPSEPMLRVSAVKGPNGVLFLWAAGKFCRDTDEGIRCDLDREAVSGRGQDTFRMNEVNINLREHHLDEKDVRS